MEGILRNRRVLSILLMVLPAVFLNACGGGGGAAAGIIYTGKTNQAIVDNGNAADVSTGALQGGSAAGVFGGIAAVGKEDHQQIGHPRTLKLIRALERAVGEVDVTTPSGVAVSGAIQHHFR